jgi:predicted nucleic acid-binding protein
MLRAFERFEIVQVTPELIHEAVDCSILGQLSFWDALVIVCAESANCSLLWSEDLSGGQVVRGVRIENPLARVPS